MDKRSFTTCYLHLSRVDVSTGGVVAKGQMVGLSGNTGCSSGPHLHFDLKTVKPKGTRASTDPFGSSGSGNDPWLLKPEGTSSRDASRVFYCEGASLRPLATKTREASHLATTCEGQGLPLSLPRSVTLTE
jgi:murein DD-endopeptidase MepM/ murein hydrolase activator NlpD